MWEEMVVDVGSMHRTGPTLCSGLLHYYKAHGTDEHECDFMFMQDGTVRHFIDGKVRYSQWKRV